MLDELQRKAEAACHCGTCMPHDISKPETIRMIVCTECGCKRCPRANNHASACTGELVAAETPSGVTHTCSGCKAVATLWAERESLAALDGVKTEEGKVKP